MAFLSSDQRLIIFVVEDLTWELLQMVGVNGTRMVYYFQTEPFAIPRGWRDPTGLSRNRRSQSGSDEPTSSSLTGSVTSHDLLG